MTVIEELEAITNRMVESDCEMSDYAVLGLDKYKQLAHESLSVYDSNSFPNTTITTVHLPYCILHIKINPQLPSDHLSVGRMTLNDIIIEDILLDDETYQDLL